MSCRVQSACPHVELVNGLVYGGVGHGHRLVEPSCRSPPSKLFRVARVVERPAVCTGAAELTRRIVRTASTRLSNSRAEWLLGGRSPRTSGPSRRAVATRRWWQPFYRRSKY